MRRTIHGEREQAVEKLQRLVNTNFDEKDLKVSFSYENKGLKTDTNLLIVNKRLKHSIEFYCKGK